MCAIIHFIGHVEVGYFVEQGGVVCLTASNALLKSSDMTITYGLSTSIRVTTCRREIIATVGDPLGRKAYLSENCDIVDGEVIDGYWVIIILFMILVSTGVMDIGRKSVISLGWATFGAGLMYASFHSVVVARNGESGLMRWACPFVGLSVCLLLCLFQKCKKCDFLKN